MNHTNMKQNLVSYVRGDLNESQVTAIREHLLECVQCRDELASVSRLHSALKQAVPTYWNCPDPGPKLASSVDARSLDEPRSPGWLERVRSDRPWFVPAGVAVISLLLVLMAVVALPPVRDLVVNGLGIARNQGVEVTVVGKEIVLVMRVPQTDYHLGDTIEATVVVKNRTSRSVDVSGYNDQYFNIHVEDNVGNQVFDWLTSVQGATSAGGRKSTLTLQPGASVMSSLEFTASEPGVLALKASTIDGLLVTKGIDIKIAVIGPSGG